MKSVSPQLSVVIPAHNEEKNIPVFFNQLQDVLKKEAGLTYEIIFVDDGSLDGTLAEIKKIARKNDHVRVVVFSRNFGKEIATSAGIKVARGDAIVMLDADGQHPPELIPTFIKEWRKGSRVVVGVRKANQKEGFVKRYGSKIFYKVIRIVAHVDLVPGSTDFRLIDRTVQKEFNTFTERNRITRGLIDWVGFTRTFVEFNANARMAGEASYKFSKLVKLAVNSFVSLTLAPLYFSAWAGGVITVLALAAGIFVAVEQFLLNDPLGLNITGTAMLAIMLLFLVGLVLVSQGLMALYISHIHTETQNRPLYVLDEDESIRL